MFIYIERHIALACNVIVTAIPSVLDCLCLQPAS